MKDIRLDIGFYDHPKTIKLKRRLGQDSIEGLHRIWFFAAKNRTKGILSGMTAEDIAIAAGWQQDVQQFVDILLELGWLDVSEDGSVYSLHDWEEHQGFIYLSEERRAKCKKAGKASADKRLSKAIPQHDVEQGVEGDAEHKTKNSSTPFLSYPFLIKEILAYLNSQAGRNFRESTRATQSVIKARLTEKYTVDDFKNVIDKKVAAWKDDSKMCIHLCPTTLFGPNFEKYLNEPDKQSDWRG